MRRDIATVVCLVVFVFAAGIGMIPGATQYAAVTAQAAQERAQLANLQQHNAELPQVERELNAYKKLFGTKLGNVTEQHAADAFAQSTLTIGRKYHVGFGQQTLAGPLAAPTALPIDAALTGGPTPPPTPPPLPGAAPIVTPVPASAASSQKLVGFAVAQNLPNDPWAQPLAVFAGSIALTGSYPDLIAALQAMSRETAFVRVLRATMCRPENDVSSTRTLTVVFRLYGLPNPLPTAAPAAGPGART